MAEQLGVAANRRQRGSQLVPASTRTAAVVPRTPPAARTPARSAPASRSATGSGDRPRYRASARDALREVAAGDGRGRLLDPHQRPQLAAHEPERNRRHRRRPARPGSTSNSRMASRLSVALTSSSGVAMASRTGMGSRRCPGRASPTRGSRPGVEVPSGALITARCRSADAEPLPKYCEAATWSPARDDGRVAARGSTPSDRYLGAGSVSPRRSRSRPACRRGQLAVDPVDQVGVQEVPGGEARGDQAERHQHDADRSRSRSVAGVSTFSEAGGSRSRIRARSGSVPARPLSIFLRR